MAGLSIIYLIPNNGGMVREGTKNKLKGGWALGMVKYISTVMGI